MRITVLLLLGPWFWPDLGSAQTPLSGPAASVLFSAPQRGALGSMRLEALRDTVPAQLPPTYWKEGALIGGALGALGGALLGHAVCETSDESGKSCTGSLFLGGVLGAAILAIPGALIGGQFPKRAQAEAGQPE